MPGPAIKDGVIENIVGQKVLGEKRKSLAHTEQALYGKTITSVIARLGNMQDEEVNRISRSTK